MTSNQWRRDAVLRHIARYGLTLQPVLANVFYRDHEKTLDRDLERMREYDWIAAVENAIPEEGDAAFFFAHFASAHILPDNLMRSSQLSTVH